MKRTVSLLLCVCFVLTVFSVLLSVPFIKANPFEAFDKAREQNIASSLSARPFNSVANESERKQGCIVKFKSDTTLEDIYNCVNNYAYRLLANSSERLFWIDASTAFFKSEHADIVESAEEEQTLSLSATVNDPLSSSQWELDHLQAYRAWDVTTGERNVTVAVLDSGIYRAHPDFENVSILAGYDAVTRTEGVSQDVNGHGTKITSIIAAATDNGIGMAGIASNVSILPIRISNSTGYIHSSDFIDAVYYAADAGVDIINMSFGGYTYSAMEEVAISYASEKGCVLVSAAGNNETSTQYAGMKAYPASYTGVISVGAVDVNGVLCPFSQRNDAVDLVAPGADVTVANTNDSYEKENGTSFASAYVTAVAALCLSAIDEGVRFSSDQFLSLIAKINGGVATEGYGYGHINAYSALTKINTPLVSGVADGGVYHKNVTITFNRGEATLDGEEFESGEAVITSGSHTLEVTDGRNTLTIDFITDNIPLKYEYSVGTSSAAITFSRGTATLDGIPYLSGAPITASGKHCFKLTGPYGNTESYEFECNFKAPEIFGVENGGVYTYPVRISAGAGGVLTLNGTVIPAEKIVSQSGVYTLVSSTADGKNKKTLRFTVSIPNASIYSSTVVSPKIIADDKYRTVVLYNDVLSGVRVFSWGDLTRTKCFIRTQSAVIGHCLYGEKLVLIHSGGISVCERSAIAAGTVSSLLYYGFERTASAATALGGYVYYTCPAATETQLWRMDIASGKSTLITSFSGNADMLCTDGTALAAASKNGTVYIFSQEGKLNLKINVGEDINSVAICGDYLCTNKYVYGTASNEKLFSLKDGETVVFAKNNVLVTDYSVYDLKGRRAIAAFGDRLIDAVITSDGYTFKAIEGMKIELINNQGLRLGADNAAKLLNAAEVISLTFGAPNSFSVHESYVSVPDSLYISDAVIPTGTGSIFAISPSEQMLYTIDCASLTVTARTSLRFKPSSICSDGENVYIAFSNEESIFVCSVNGGAGDYLSSNESYTKILYSDQRLYGLTESGDILSMSAADPKATQTVIKAQNVINFTYGGGYVYAYLKPVTIPMLYKIDASSFSIESAVQVADGGHKLFAENDMVFLGKKAFYSNDLEPAYTLNSNVEIAYRSYVLTSNGLYFSSNGVLIGDIKTNTTLPLFDSGYNYYSFENGRICKISNPRADLHSTPAVSGITPNTTIHGSASAVFAYGYGYLDGVPYNAGALIENGGIHSLVISLPFGVTTKVDFVIEAQINSISLSSEKLIISVNETTRLQVTARPYTYGVVDVSYTTDNENVIVLPDGSIIGAAEGVCAITATTADGKHSASILITVTKGVLRFDSSYFYADGYNRIVRGIAPGTGIETFLAAAAETHGTVAIRGYNGVLVSAGMIHTGMKAELYNVYDEVIDSWDLSVTGDIDEDGYVTANDYYALEKLLVDTSTASASVYAAADIDGNRFVNEFDLLALKQHFLGNPFINTTNATPTRPTNTSIHIMAPKALAAGTSFTVGITLTEMKGLTAVSGLLKFDAELLKPESVRVYGAETDGFHTISKNGVYFYTSCAEDMSTNVILTAEFTVSEALSVDTPIRISCAELVVYDGSAAFIEDKATEAKVSQSPETDILLFNLPDFNFDSTVTEYRCVFPADTQEIHIGTYPKQKCDIAGETIFTNENHASFAVVVKDESGTTQYNYECERAEGTTHSPNNNNIYKNNNTSLSELTVEGATLSPQFDKAVTTYYVVCKNPLEIAVSARAENENTVVSVSQYNEKDGTITVICTAEDGSTASYTLHVCEKLPIFYEVQNGSNLWLWLFSIPALLLVVLITLIVILVVKKQKLKKTKRRTA